MNGFKKCNKPGPAAPPRGNNPYCELVQEFAESVRDQNADFTALLVDEYAAKLRLAGEDA